MSVALLVGGTGPCFLRVVGYRSRVKVFCLAAFKVKSWAVNLVVTTCFSSCERFMWYFVEILILDIYICFFRTSELFGDGLHSLDSCVASKCQRMCLFACCFFPHVQYFKPFGWGRFRGNAEPL